MKRPGGRVSRWVQGTGIAGTVFIAVGAFWLSFTALTHLAEMSGITPNQAWAWPLIVDGIIVVATVSVVAMAGKRGAWYPWLLLVGGALVSVTANAIQAAMSASVEVPHVMAAAVAAVPPIVLLAITHLTVVLTRTDDDQAPISATSESSPRPVSVTEPAATSELALPGPPLMPVAELVSPESSSPSGSDLMSIFAINDELVDENQEVRERSRTWELEQAKQMRSEGMSFSSIGKALGRDGTTISRWLREPEAAGE